MNTLQKKIVSALLVCAVLILGTVIVREKDAEIIEESVSGTQEAEPVETLAYQQAAADLVLWYEDETYTAFFETAAERYFSRTGTKVSVEYQETIDYMGDIYDKTMQDEAFPDVYLISGDNLEEAYLYGLVSVNETETEESGVAANAIAASIYKEKLLGYPLSYNICLLIYQTGYFETEPESLQAIIDYANENEPGEDVEYLLEWDVNDAFYDFPFVSNSVTFEKTEEECMTVLYDEDLHNQDLIFFEEILESFSVDAETVSEDSIIENFLAGRTLCAIVDSDSLCSLEEYTYSLMDIPRLNETLGASTCAKTDMLLVNEFSTQGDMAADFARFVTADMAGELYELSGHFSVILSEDAQTAETVAYQAYESAILMPDSQDAKDFWVNLEETISKYF